MAPYYSYKETRLNLDPTVQDSTIAIRLPSTGSLGRASKTAQNRSHIADIPIADDEVTFRQRHLASAGSIYHRVHHRSPRSFLWRVLEDEKVLSIQAIDICKRSPDTPEGHLTLRITFPHSIKPSCVAFADGPEHDVLYAFVLTDAKQLYTLTLRPEYFRRASSTEDNVLEWCKAYASSAIGMKNAHRLVALAANEVLVSFIDGGLLRLSKASGGDGSQWSERHYSEGGWSLRGVFQASTTIRYGNLNLDRAAATSISSPVTTIDGSPYIFTICLDHRMRVWNLKTGKIAFIGDILDQDLEPQEQAKQVIPPSYSQLVRVYENKGENAVCVTYSPLGTGRFKFWSVTPAPDGNLQVSDMFPQNNLEPFAPSAELWTLADFSVVVDRTSAQGYKLWTLWKNNISYRVLKLEFQNNSIAKMTHAWKNDWQAMAQESLLDAALPITLPSDPSDTTDQWLNFILAPGRFSIPTIETGLAIYERGSGAISEPIRKASLSERLCATIGSTVSLGRAANTEMDYEQFRTATDVQWRRFYRLLLELQGQRGEALAMILDPVGELPQIVLADGISIIRKGSSLEQLWHNPKSAPVGAEHIARPIIAASNFRDSISDQFLHNCKTALLAEMFEEPSLAGPSRIKAFYDKCDFSNQISDEDYNQLVSSLGGDFKKLTEEVYKQLLALFDGPKAHSQRTRLEPFGTFGSSIILRGLQEMVDLQKNIALDQLIVLVLVEAEINHGEEGNKIESSLFFLQLIDHLKRLELIHWLASNKISLPLERTERSGSGSDKAIVLAKPAGPDTETITILEGVFRHLFGADLKSHLTFASAITDVLDQICDPESREYETRPVAILGWLLSMDRVDLASDFVRFVNGDSFSVYMLGRVALSANDALDASLQFKKAAFGLSTSDKGDYSSSGFLGNTAKEAFDQGLSKYYAHIVSLYEKVKHFSYAIDFCRLALQFLPPNQEASTIQARTELNSRLFNAAIQTSRYDLAHSTLVVFTDHALQKSCLRTLVTRLCETSNASKLIALPFLTLQDQVDEILTQKASSIVDPGAGTPYHKILYAWRIAHNDFRGAASISLERLQRLQLSGEGDKFLQNGTGNPETAVTKGYVQLINALACVDEKQAWVLAEEVKRPGKTSEGKRRVVRLEDVRRAYSEELDRINAVGRGDFGLLGDGGDEDDAMDIL